MRRPDPQATGTEAARQRLAVVQLAAVEALVAGEPGATGMDAHRVAVQARLLAAKRELHAPRLASRRLWRSPYTGR